MAARASSLLRKLPRNEFTNVGQIPSISYTDVIERIKHLPPEKWLHPRIILEIHYSALDRTTKKYLRYLKPIQEEDKENEKLWDNVKQDRLRFRKIVVFITERASITRYKITKLS